MAEDDKASKVESNKASTLETMENGGNVENTGENTVENTGSNTVERFANYVLESEQDVQRTRNTYLLQFYLIVIAIRLAFIFIVWKFLWPKVMPKIASNIKAKPTFVSLLGLSMIYSLLF